jgi:hypothetical protein
MNEMENTTEETLVPVEHDMYGDTKNDIERNLLLINRSNFRSSLEKLMHDDRINIIEAIVEFCKMNTLDIEDVQSLIDPFLKEKIEECATLNNLLKKKEFGAVLPI